MSRWVQENQGKLSANLGERSKGRRGQHSGESIQEPDSGIRRVNELLSFIPAEVISHRAVECNSYARALFHWEQHIRQVRENSKSNTDLSPMLERLQDIYAQIDEPDGIEGISTQLHVLDIDQQIISHRKAGRWAAAQSWYEIKLAEQPDDVDVQVNLLNCLKDSGQYGMHYRLLMCLRN